MIAVVMIAVSMFQECRNHHVLPLDLITKFMHACIFSAVWVFAWPGYQNRCGMLALARANSFISFTMQRYNYSGTTVDSVALSMDDKAGEMDHRIIMAGIANIVVNIGTTVHGVFATVFF
jgi:hypothetical protein